MSDSIGEWQVRVHALAKEKGWWFGEKHNVAEKLALIHSEVSEALEEARLPNADLRAITFDSRGKPVGFAVELADAVIRIMDLAEYLGIDLEEVISAKHVYNQTRGVRHGGKNF